MSTINRVEFHSLNRTSTASIPATRPVQKMAIPHDSFAAFVGNVDPSAWKYVLWLSDSLLIFVACLFAYIARYVLQWFIDVEPASDLAFSAYIPAALGLMFLLPIAFRLSKVYPYRRGQGRLEEVYAIATTTTASVVVVIAISLLFQSQLDSRLMFLYIAIFITTLLSISRFVITILLSYLRKYDVGVERILLVGAGDVGRMVMRNIVARPELGYKLVGFVDDNPVKGNTDIGTFPALGAVENIDTVLANEDVQRLIICLPWQSHRTTQRLLRLCATNGVVAQVVPDLFQATKNQMVVEQLNGIPLISTSDVSIKGWNLIVKRIIDILLISLIFFFGWPIGLLIAMLIRLDSAGPIIYWQTRVGKNGKEFRCYKFRSMVDGADGMREELAETNEATGPLFKMKDDPRLTTIGRFLRRYSLDELPQLYNVFCGDMSLIGPRPNRPEEVAQFSEWHKKRMSASPGLTGLAQVSGRSDLTFDETVLLDIYYVENWTILLDINIVLRSVPAVLRAHGAY